MKIKIQIVIESDGGGDECVQEVAQIDRGELNPEGLGLTLAEAKQLLQSVQRSVVERQAAEYLAGQSNCPDCGKKRLRKGEHEIIFRTLFGKLRLASPRLFHCECRPYSTRSFSPLAELLPERTSPELLYLETKFASLMSYGLSLKVLEEVLPIGEELNAATLRNHLLGVGRRLEDELGEEKMCFIEGCERDWEQLPRPDLPLTVGLDGGYVHSHEQPSRKEGWFEVIVGKSLTVEKDSRCFAFVNSIDEKPKRRLFEILRAQGMQMNQQVTFMSDGGDTVRELQMYLNPQAEHLLDWFHLTMRLTVMTQLAKGIGSEDSKARTAALKELERIKWYLWHGNTFLALQKVEDLQADLDSEDEEVEEESAGKLCKALEEFQTYIENNKKMIVNYGERWRAGERISTGFVESAVNSVVSRRMVKKQQMRWSKRGAHLLLQVRTRVLDAELRNVFHGWYPGFKTEAAGQNQTA
jgi:hypothetical protein